jgi:hypothetical protein
MSLRLELSVENPRLTVFESLRVGITLENLGPAARNLPGSEDESDALSIFVYREDGAPSMLMSGLTSQAMMSTARVDRRVAREILLPGGRWNWRVDLAGWHYPLPAGRYHIEALLADADAGVQVRSALLPVESIDPGLSAISFMRANPVIDGLAILFHSGEKGAWIRQSNATRPLAAWYSRPLVSPWAWARNPVLSQPLFFRPESFDSFFRQWLVGVQSGELFAQPLDSGEAAHSEMRALLPPGRALLPWAFHDYDGTLYLALSPARFTFEIFAWDSDGLRHLFRHDLPSRGLFCLGADEDAVYVASEDGGLALVALDWAGRMLSRRRASLRGLTARWIEFDVVDRTFYACFRDGAFGKSCACIVAGLDQAGEENPFMVYPLDFGLRGDIGEMHFRRDKRSRMHVLFATGGGKLYYKCGTKALMRVADGQAAWFPRISSAGRTHVGFYREGIGFRFREVNPGRGRRLKEAV